MPKGDVNRNKTHCSNGHKYTPANTRIVTGNCRQCKICDYLRACRCSDKRKAELVEAYGGKCAWPGCDVTDPDMLNIDHVCNDGKLERQRGNTAWRSSGFNFYIRLKKAGYPKGKYQLLCANHNLKKEIMRRKALRDAYVQRLSESCD